MKFTKIDSFYLVFSIIIISIFSSCSSTNVDQIDRGIGYNYQPGYPELRVISSSFIDQNEQTYINITSEIVFGSLIYKKVDSIYTANAFIEYQIINKQKQEDLIDTKQYPIEISSFSNEYSYDQTTYKLEKDFPVPPGDYIIHVSVTDENTDKQITRSSEIFIPSLESSINNITNIRIFSKASKNESTFEPSTTYDIQSDHDSLKFVFQVTNNNPASPLTLNSKLIRFKSDTSIARPMNYVNYSTGSIQYKGIDYSEQEIINTSRRVLTNPGNVLIEFSFSTLKRGNYRFEVSSTIDEDNTLYKAREFSIKSPNYPSLRTAKELAAPLYYLMNDKEYDALLALEDNSDIKKAIDRFWLSNIKNANKARSVVELYYERVEEANKQFSSYKEGWKTDQGMIYILFGSPWYVDKSLNTEFWRYSYNSGDPEKNFYFQAPKLKNKYYPFDNYLLMRSQGYYNVQYQQINLWLSGLILQRQN